MGQAMIVPENDDRMEKLTILFHLTELDVAQFYQIFAALGETSRYCIAPPPQIYPSPPPPESGFSSSISGDIYDIFFFAILLLLMIPIPII